MEYSCLKTLAAKHRTKISKIRSKYRMEGKNGEFHMKQRQESKDDI